MLLEEIAGQMATITNYLCWIKNKKGVGEFRRDLEFRRPVYRRIAATSAGEEKAAVPAGLRGGEGGTGGAAWTFRLRGPRGGRLFRGGCPRGKMASRWKAAGRDARP